MTESNLPLTALYGGDLHETRLFTSLSSLNIRTINSSVAILAVVVSVSAIKRTRGSHAFSISLTLRDPSLQWNQTPVSLNWFSNDSTFLESLHWHVGDLLIGRNLRSSMFREQPQLTGSESKSEIFLFQPQVNMKTRQHTLQQIRKRFKQAFQMSIFYPDPHDSEVQRTTNDVIHEIFDWSRDTTMTFHTTKGDVPMKTSTTMKTPSLVNWNQILNLQYHPKPSETDFLKILRLDSTQWKLFSFSLKLEQSVKTLHPFIMFCIHSLDAWSRKFLSSYTLEIDTIHMGNINRILNSLAVCYRNPNSAPYFKLPLMGSKMELLSCFSPFVAERYLAGEIPSIPAAVEKPLAVDFTALVLAVNPGEIHLWDGTTRGLLPDVFIGDTLKALAAVPSDMHLSNPELLRSLALLLHGPHTSSLPLAEVRQLVPENWLVALRLLQENSEVAGKIFATQLIVRVDDTTHPHLAEKFQPGQWVRIRSLQVDSSTQIVQFIHDTHILAIEPESYDVVHVAIRYIQRVIAAMTLYRELTSQAVRDKQPPQRQTFNSLGAPYYPIYVITASSVPATYANFGRVVGWAPLDVSKFVARSSLSDDQSNSVLQFRLSLHWSDGDVAIPLLVFGQDANTLMGCTPEEFSSREELRIQAAARLESLVSSRTTLDLMISVYFVPRIVNKVPRQHGECPALYQSDWLKRYAAQRIQLSDGQHLVLTSSSHNS